MRYYVDTCIWLNIFKQEESHGVQYWRIAKEFIERRNGDVLYCSNIVRKELQYKLEKQNLLKRMHFIEQECIFISPSSEEYALARKIESGESFSISFADILHLLMARRYDAILITRDKLLIKTAKKYGVLACRPEEIT
jgi:predicted nucleic acid-binding protein